MNPGFPRTGLAVTHPSHELRVFGWPIQSYDFTLFGHPAACPEALKATAIWVRLDDPGFERKRSAVAGYSPKLAAEVDALLRGALRRGTDRFADPALALAAASE